MSISDISKLNTKQLDEEHSLSGGSSEEAASESGSEAAETVREERSAAGGSEGSPEETAASLSAGEKAAEEEKSSESRSNRGKKTSAEGGTVISGKKGITALGLKLIVCISMIFDHTAIFLFTPGTKLYIAFRAVGRMAFPLVTFLLVEGFLHTRSRKRYGIRLAVFGLLSEPVFVVMKAYFLQRYLEVNGGTGLSTEEASQLIYDTQDTSIYADWILPLSNPIITLFVCFLMLLAIDKIMKRFWEKKRELTGFETALKLSCILMIFVTACFLDILLDADYAIFGPLYVLIFYYFRKDENMFLLLGAIMAIVNFGSLSDLPYTIGLLLPILLMKFYRGELGYRQGKNPVLQYGFYLFYPFHLCVLFGLFVLMNR